MTQFVAVFANNHGKLLQMFGPYASEEKAQEAIERLEDWPALKSGEWTIQPLYADPEKAPASTITVTYPNVTWQVQSPNYLPYSYGQLASAMAVRPNVTWSHVISSVN